MEPHIFCTLFEAEEAVPGAIFCYLLFRSSQRWAVQDFLDGTKVRNSSLLDPHSERAVLEERICVVRGEDQNSGLARDLQHALLRFALKGFIADGNPFVH